MPKSLSYPHDLFTDEVLLDPHEHYRALRELGQVVWLEAHDMYVVPRYAEVRHILGDADTFCSGQGVGMSDAINQGPNNTGSNLIMTDGQQHEHLRGIFGQGLTPRALRSLRETVEQLAANLVADLLKRGSFDAVADLARALPLSVVPDLVGWPVGGREHLLEWAAASFDLLGPFNTRAQQASPKVKAMREFTARTAAEGDLIPGGVGTAVLEAVARGDLEPAQVPPLLVSYVAPSLDTTISAIGSAVWLLATHPHQWSVLKADPSLIPNALNETVRLESPIRAFTRVATTGTNIGDFKIDRGSRVMVLYASANRDERQFDRADEFDITRSNAAEHVGFGYGVHSCAGQGLARLEAHAVLRALVDQVDVIELGEPVRGLNNIISAWAALPVTVRPARELSVVADEPQASAPAKEVGGGGLYRCVSQ